MTMNYGQVGCCKESQDKGAKRLFGHLVGLVVVKMYLLVEIRSVQTILDLRKLHKCLLSNDSQVWLPSMSPFWHGQW